MRSPTRVFLHGFLGLPSDWHQVGLEGNYVSLSSLRSSPIPSADILIGYSLGARLCLGSLAQGATRWKGAVIVSGHPGLPAVARAERLKNDQAWAERFLNSDWTQLMETWNAQPVLATSSPMPIQRLEKDFDRAELAWELDHWSLGRQDDYSLRLGEIKIPTLWISGARDTKFTEIARNAQAQNSLAQLWVAKDAGHRVPWDRTAEFRAKVLEFERELCGLTFA